MITRPFIFSESTTNEGKNNGKKRYFETENSNITTTLLNYFQNLVQEQKFSDKLIFTLYNNLVHPLASQATCMTKTIYYDKQISLPLYHALATAYLIILSPKILDKSL